MVRLPHTPAQLEAGRRLGAQLRAARGSADPAAIARAAGISPETLRKIESGRLATPAFGTVVGLARALDIPLEDLASCWESATLSDTA
ncbi:helix-turn-helix domain-containing protein [Nocardia stercoris]|uniref:XRE family transcriptional regulator n=1 Tax=Nocardia stercoris TaxID=2483361 RepID=A0A3M2L2F1_9NOCA|nr:helix-turn-helix transcriptional regulator [Nocardia stercoris]RMI31899.1 XRE family transcriptional regulator [Nocardia stercoris]